MGIFGRLVEKITQSSSLLFRTKKGYGSGKILIFADISVNMSAALSKWIFMPDMPPESKLFPADQAKYPLA